MSTEKIHRFFRSPLYVAALTLLIYLGWLFKLTLPVLYAVCALAAFIFFTHKDLTPLIVPVLMITYLFSTRAMYIDFYAVLLPTIPVLAASIVYYIIRNKPSFKKGAFFLGFLCAFVGAATGGLFFDGDLAHFAVVAALSALLVGTYIFFSSLCGEGFKQTVLYCFTAISVLLIAQVLSFYLTAEVFLDAIQSKAIHIGWGMSNNIAVVLSMLIPVSLYQASKGKPWFYASLAFFQMLTIVFMQSRGNIIIAGFFFLPLLFISYKYSTCKKAYGFTVLTALGLALAALAAFSLLGELDFKYLQRFGMGDTGRVTLFRDAFQHFGFNPVFGVGFYYMHAEIPHWYHSTPLQLMASLGVFGTLMFLPFIWQRYAVPLKRFNFSTLFMLSSILMSAAYGLMEINFFYIYTNLIIISMYIIIEKEKDTVNIAGKLLARLKKTAPLD